MGAGSEGTTHGNATSGGSQAESTDGESDGHEDSTGAGASTGDGGAETTGGEPVHMFDLPALELVNDGRFATSEACTSCHTAEETATAMRDEAGRDVSPHALWQASMMANSARDPFWWAMVTAETVATPSQAAAIEGECTRCHAPMAAARPDLWDDVPMSLALLETDPERGQLGIDGVACSACHKLGDADLDGESQWSGRLDLRPEPQMMGPHADPFPNPMTMHTGFEPVQATHFSDAATCAGCHTLDTETLAADGTPTGGHYSEQAPYLEWLNSAYSTKADAPGPQARSCQSCHMPSVSEDGVPLSTRIARRPPGGDFPPVSERSPYSRHTFVGGNTLVPAMLRDHADALRPIAPTEAFDEVIARTTAQLQSDTATLTLGAVDRDGDMLSVTARVENHVGHKFPSGFPSRRAWLELVVTDARGVEVFHSGGVDAQGRIVDGRGGVLDSETVGGAPQPHFDAIDDASQVQIYEVVMAGTSGDPVYRLLRATEDYKDNRLLPAGWGTDSPYLDRIEPVLGSEDTNFIGGRDDVTFRVAAPEAAGPYTVEARLQYQTISARFAAELFAIEAPEVRAFEAMWDQADRAPVVVASAQASG